MKTRLRGIAFRARNPLQNKASEINMFDYFKRNKASFLLKNNEAKAINTIV